MAFENIRAMLNKGIPYEMASELAALTTVDAADGADSSYGAPEETLLNEVKADHNELLNAIRT